ncbi:hypothetical protein E4U21_003404 [Claviceps maximensis]|nr:hypothetical protein E4U21_003404 [Claviceps maximensis]
MGLLAENKRQDPNNTKWTRDTTTFGQKILRSQGWQPGQYLGVQDAAHSELYTAANASYIRVTLKDDMKGLGFNKAHEDQVTGLDVFSDLLSRLNGKSEDSIEGEKQARLEVKTHRYVEAKWGPMRFVRGGLLVGDEMKEVPVEEADALGAEMQSQSQNMDDKSGKSKKSKKRKAAEVLDDEDVESSQDATKKQEKRRRKEERRLAKKSSSCDEDDVSDEKSSGRLKEKKKNKKKRSKKDKSKSVADLEEAQKEEDDDDNDERDNKEEEEVHTAKEKSKKQKKDKKKTRKRDAEPEVEAETEAESTTKASSSTGTTTGMSTPTRTGAPAPGSRNFVRSRFIAQKRQAVLDTKALAQIFMVKT